MIPVPTGVRVWLATGYTDMRRGFPGLSLQVQEVLRRDPLSGHLFCFRGRRGDLLKVIWHDGQGACLFFATSHGNMAGLRLEAEGGRSRVLSPGELDRLLDQHCGDRPTVAILSDCDAGVFLDSRMRQPNRILIAASSRGRTSYGAKLYERHVNFDRCLMGAIDAGASTWREAFQRTLPCVQERETWLGVRASDPQAFFGAAVADLAIPGAAPLTARMK